MLRLASLRELRARRTRAAAICHDLRGWAADFPGATYEVLDAAHSTTRALPRAFGAPVDPSFVELRDAQIPERALVRLPGARVTGKSGLVQLPTQEFAGELVAVTPKGRAAMLDADSAEAASTRRCTRHAGAYLSVLGYGPTHYYHWGHDVVMRLRGLAGKLPTEVVLLLPANRRRFQDEMLSLLELDDHARVEIAPDDCWQVDELFVVSPRLKTQLDSPAPYEWFRAAVFARFGIGESKGTRRFYLSRRDDSHWRTVNEADVEAALRPLGFETVQPATLSFPEQVALFAQAETIVGTGAGLFNMVFAPRGVRIVQLQEPTHIVHALWTMACAVDAPYSYVMCEAVPNPGSDADVRVPIDVLVEAIGAQ